MNEKIRSRFPIFGILSLLPPVLIWAMWRLFNHSPGITDAANGYAGMLIAAFLYLGTGLLGLSVIGCLILAVVRRERFWFLGLGGLLGVALVWKWLK